MKNKNLFIALLTFGLVLSGCNKTSNVSSNNTSSSSKIESTTTSSSSSVFKGYVELTEAFSNTVYYGLARNTEKESPLIEAWMEDMYYNNFYGQGFVELDSDPGYLHAFNTIYYDYNSNDVMMEVFGRNNYIENLSTYEERTIKYLISEKIDLFEQVDENTYSISDYAFIRSIADFYQSKAYRYATEITLTVGKDDRLETINIYEEDYLLTTSKFVDINYRDLKMYKLWVDKGAVVAPRIYDYKSLIVDNDNFISVYEKEVIEFEATVVAKDCYGNVYVANRDDRIGHLGIQVAPKTSFDNVNVKDIVIVKGEVTTKNYVTSIKNAEITDTGNDAKFAPIFDEDSVVDNYGGGTYAAQLFASYPYFGDSLYSTYAYLYNLPVSLNNNGDTIIDVVCPTQVNSLGEMYHMQVVIPKNLSQAKKEELYNAIKDGGLFETVNSYELSLENFVSKWVYQYPYKIQLLATEDSEVYKRPNAIEKVERFVGFSGLPSFGDKNVVSYKFGGFSGIFLEKEYGLEEGDTEGVYIMVTNMNKNEMKAYFNEMEKLGAVKYDEVDDAYTGRHVIYQIGNTNFDFMYSEVGVIDSTPTLCLWAYNGDLLKGASMEERITQEIGGWFNVDNFLKLSGTYDADYSIFKLYDYANQSFDLDNPLYCVTIDLQENRFNDYIKGLIDLGYKQRRTESNKPYTYTSRGQTHYVLHMDDVNLDIAVFHTSDYTYTGHSEFEYRIEVLIYKGEPMSVQTYDNLDVLSSCYEAVNPELGYDIDLPEGTVVEIWRDLKDYTLSSVEYGYGCRDEAFIYTSNVEEIYEICKEGVEESGYKLSRENTYSALYFKSIDGMSYSLLILKEPDKGYVRLFNSLGGVDFIR